MTNYHVIEGAAYAMVRTIDGAEYDVLGVYDFSVENDLAILQVDGSGFPALTVGDSRNLVTGADVYAIGSPLGLEIPFPTAVFPTQPASSTDSVIFQINVSISPGSSGGALLNSRGQVIGVTTASYVSGQNLNLAVPIHLLEGLSTGSYTPLVDYVNPVTYYAGLYPAVDFGNYVGASVYYYSVIPYNGNIYYDYYYDCNDIPYSDYGIGVYGTLLIDNGFYYAGYDYDSYGNIYYVFENDLYVTIIAIGLVSINGVDCVDVTVMT